MEEDQVWRGDKCLHKFTAWISSALSSVLTIHYLHPPHFSHTKPRPFALWIQFLPYGGIQKNPKHLHMQSTHSSVLFSISKAFRNTLMLTLYLSSKCPKAAATPWTSKEKLYSQITSQEHQRVCLFSLQAFNYEGAIIIHALRNVRNGKLKLYCWSILVCCADQSWFNEEHLLEALIASLISRGNIWLGWSTTFVVFTVS